MSWHISTLSFSRPRWWPVPWVREQLTVSWNEVRHEDVCEVSRLPKIYWIDYRIFMTFFTILWCSTLLSMIFIFNCGSSVLKFHHRHYRCNVDKIITFFFKPRVSQLRLVMQRIQDEYCHVYTWLWRGFWLVNLLIGSSLVVTTISSYSLKITVIIAQEAFNVC
jgi:hypothetical protein